MRQRVAISVEPWTPTPKYPPGAFAGAIRVLWPYSKTRFVSPQGARSESYTPGSLSECVGVHDPAAGYAPLEF